MSSLLIEAILFTEETQIYIILKGTKLHDNQTVITLQLIWMVTLKYILLFIRIFFGWLLLVHQSQLKYFSLISVSFEHISPYITLI